MPAAPEDVDRLIVDAAATCIAELGLAGTTVDAVAAQAGVSRATVYRRFGGRDDLFVGVLLRELESVMRAVGEILSGPKRFVSRFEDVFVFGVMEMPTNPWLRLMFDEGLSPGHTVLLNERMRASMHAFFGPHLLRAAADGEVRRGLDPHEVTDWLMVQIVVFAQHGPWTKARLLKRLRVFVLPVLVPDPQAELGAIQVQLRGIERHLGIES